MLVPLSQGGDGRSAREVASSARIESTVRSIRPDTLIAAISAALTPSRWRPRANCHLRPWLRHFFGMPKPRFCSVIRAVARPRRAADLQRVEFAGEGEVQRDDRRGVGGANWHGRDLARCIHQDVPRGRARPVGAAVQFEERLARTGRGVFRLGGGEHPHRTSLGEINSGCSAVKRNDETMKP